MITGWFDDALLPGLGGRRLGVGVLALLMFHILNGDGNPAALHLDGRTAVAQQRRAVKAEDVEHVRVPVTTVPG